MQQQPSSVQCNYCKKLDHTIEKCYKLQRKRNGENQSYRGRRLAASVQEVDIGIEAASAHSSGHHTLSSEQCGQLLTLLSKQNMEVTPNVDNTQAAFLASKSFSFSLHNQS